MRSPTKPVGIVIWVVLYLSLAYLLGKLHLRKSVVNGISVNGLHMPAFGKMASQEDINRALNYIINRWCTE